MEVRIKLVPQNVIGVPVYHLMAEFKLGEDNYRTIGFYPKNFRGTIPFMSNAQAGLVTPDPLYVSKGIAKGTMYDISPEIASFKMSKEEADRMKELLKNSPGKLDRSKYVFELSNVYYRAVTLPSITGDGIYNCATWLRTFAFPGRFKCSDLGLPATCYGEKELEMNVF